MRTTLNIAFVAAFAFCLSLVPVSCAHAEEPPVRCRPVAPKVTDDQVDAMWAQVRAWECK